jgi:hypothetical protein
MGTQVITSNTGAAILPRIVRSDELELTPDAARFLLPMMKTASISFQQKRVQVG